MRNSLDIEFSNDPFNVVFYEVVIDQIWQTETISFSSEEFRFPLQTLSWDGSASSDRKVWSYINYEVIDESGDAYITAIFTEFVENLFETGTESDRIWIEYVGSSPIELEVYELSFSREV